MTYRTIIGSMLLAISALPIGWGRLAVSTTMANPVTQSQALSTARQFMAERGINIPATASSRVANGAWTMDNSAGGDLQSPAPFYVFNADRGYVIVSGDDRMAPVLGYADSGTFDEENMAEGLRWLLQTYKEQMEQLDELFALHEAKMLAPAKNPSRLYHTMARHSIDPLLPMNWNQGDPYNLLCPRYYNEDGTQGGLSATGCVATAMAQVIGFYRWPEKTKRTIPGYMQKYITAQGEKSVRLNSIPSGSVIDWDNILDSYNGSETEAQKMAIAQLMLWVGMDCKMNYGASSSSGYSEGIDGLVNYFDYDDGTHVAKRDNYTLQQWNDLIYNEIATGHPVPFGGQNSGGGHAFVLDGYDANGLFHVNWGWGGMSNGYYRIDILDPGNNSGIGASLTPGGYNMGQDAIIGMKRPDGVDADEGDRPQARYRLSANDWEIRGTNRFFCNFVNWSGISATWDMGIGYADEEDGLTLIGNYATAQISQNYYSGQEFTVRGLAQGIYHIVPICKRSTETVWRTNMSPALRYVYTEVDANGNVTKMEIRPLVNIALTDLTFPGNHKRGDDQSVRATFRNDGDDELFTEIHLLASQSENKGEAICRTAIDVLPGNETTISLTFKPEQTGTWNIWLATDNRGNNVVGEATIEISDEGIANAQQLRYRSHTIGNRSNGTVYGNCFQGRVTIQNISTTDSFDGIVHLWLFKQADNGYFYDAGSVYVPLQIEPRRTADAPYYFGNLELGANYAMSILYSEGGDIQDGGLRAMGRPQAGIVYWQQNQSLSGMAPQATLNTPAGALAVDMSAVAGIVKTVKPNSNPNTLYILPHGAEQPEGLDGHNVVIGNRADRIALSDTYSFFTPLSFTAGEATFTAEATQRLWKTLVLPFTPQQLPDDLSIATFTETSWQGEPCLKEVTSMERHLPYLVSTNSSEPLTFSAVEARFTPTAEAKIVIYADDYSFEGTTVSGRQQQVYTLNSAGTAFEYVDGQVSVAPFSAWFRAPEGAPAITLPAELMQGISSVKINNGNSDEMENRQSVNRQSFDLLGRPLTPQSTSRTPVRVIIHNGRKVTNREP